MLSMAVVDTLIKNFALTVGSVVGSLSAGAGLGFDGRFSMTGAAGII